MRASTTDDPDQKPEAILILKEIFLKACTAYAINETIVTELLFTLNPS